jgi:hypothetical protein
MKSFLLVVVALVTLGGTAHANPKALPFSYGTGTQAEGDLEIEQYVDVIAMRLARELPDGNAESTVVPRYQLQTELEYGLTDSIEVGVYFVFRQAASVDTPFLRFHGLKQRVRWRFTKPGSPLQMAAYGEIAELNDEIELEEKLLIDYRIGRIKAVLNLWIEQEWYFVGDYTKFIYNPTIGATYEVSPSLQVGAEYWLRGRFDDVGEDEMTIDETSGGGVKHYAGPTVMAQRGEVWMSLGAYVRLDGIGEATEVGDSFGRMWVRMIVGVGL